MVVCRIFGTSIILLYLNWGLIVVFIDDGYRRLTVEVLMGENRIATFLTARSQVHLNDIAETLKLIQHLQLL